MVAVKGQRKKIREVALLGNPNAGKTSVFNALTGLRHSTANYPGVTVEKRTGFLTLGGAGEKIAVLDLPGAYSLLPRSLDEEVVHDVLLGIREDTPPPDLVVLVLDASNLERNLYLALQVIETGLPAVAVFNMWDLAEANGMTIDLKKIGSLLGIPCIRLVASKNEGIRELKRVIERQLAAPADAVCQPDFVKFQDEIEKELVLLTASVEQRLPVQRRSAARGEALRLMGDSAFRSPFFRFPETAGRLREEVLAVRSNLTRQGVDWASAEAEARYGHIEWLCRQTVCCRNDRKLTVSDRLDRVLTHRVWGLVIFALLMAVIFQSIFNWAVLPMRGIAWLMEWLEALAAGVLPGGPLKSLVIDGMISGVGNVVVFLPQIFLLFFFIALFEDFGYMARAAFVLDRLMKKVGLNGRAFLPLLSSFACAVPGVMATRTIEDRNDRLATILVAPLMSCSARLPVYTLMIAAFVPPVRVLGLLDLKGITLFSMYFSGIAAGLAMAAIFRKTLLKGSRTPFIFELPPYRLPNFKNIFAVMWDRGKEFLYRAGNIIFWMSVLLWFLASYPKSGAVSRHFERERAGAAQALRGEALEARLGELGRLEAGEQVRESFMGMIGRTIEPVISPLGFDWKIGIGLIASFAAREVLISSLAIVYNVGEGQAPVDLVRALRQEVSPGTGRPVYTPLVGLSLMVFFIFACQCMSTIAVVRRETGGWGWPLFMFLYMTALAWGASFAVYQGGRLAGWS